MPKYRRPWDSLVGSWCSLPQSLSITLQRQEHVRVPRFPSEQYSSIKCAKRPPRTVGELPDFPLFDRRVPGGFQGPFGGYTQSTHASATTGPTQLKNPLTPFLLKSAMTILLILGIAVALATAVSCFDRWRARQYWKRKAHEGADSHCIHSANGRFHVRVKTPSGRHRTNM